MRAWEVLQSRYFAIVIVSVIAFSTGFAACPHTDGSPASEQPACSLASPLMIISDLPSEAYVNETVNFTVTALDQYGEPYVDYLGTVSFSSSDPYAMIPEDYTFVEADAGSHYFEVTFYSEGGQSLSVVDVVDDLFNATAWITVLPPAPYAMWTVLVYLDGDNDLEEVGLIDFIEMAAAGSTDDVNIVVQFDRTEGYDATYGDWTDTKRFLVEAGMLPYAENALEDLGELNMGDPGTLSDFISWGTANYPADKYMLVLWDHGGGWDGAVCWDDTDYSDALTMDEVETALAAGEHIDVLGYDACLMGMAEVIYETKEYVDYVVASEETIPWDGWPYDTIMGDLILDPTMSRAALCTCIVDRYMEFYGTSGMETISAVDVAVAEGMFTALGVFADELINALPDHKDTIQYCRLNSTVFFDGTFLDLYDFAFEVGDIYTTPELVAAADALWPAIDAAVIAEGHSDCYWDSHGVSIYFPAAGSWYWGYYSDILDFTADTSWDEFLALYLVVEEDSYEPDDDYLNATELLPSATQTHTVDDPVDADWYFFTLISADDVMIVTESATGQLGYILMWLYDESGVPDAYIGYAEGGGYDTYATVNAYLEPGTYYLEVGSYQLIDGYDITLFVGEMPNLQPWVFLDIYPWPLAGISSIFDASASYDPDGWIVSYLWDFGDGSVDEGAVVLHTYDYPGLYTLILEVVDDYGDSSFLLCDIWVDIPSEGDEYEIDNTYDQANLIEFGAVQNHSIAPGGADIDWVYFAVYKETTVDIRTEIVYYGDTVIALYDEAGVPDTFIDYNDDYSGNLSSRIIRVLQPGTYWLMVCAYGMADEIPQYYLSISEIDTVNELPVPLISWSPAEPDAGEEVIFNGYDSYDPDGWIAWYFWDFGDGATGEYGWYNHTYDEAGDYVVTLEVIDNMGSSASATATVKVGGGAEAPVASFTCSLEFPLAGEEIVFDGRPSHDNDGTIETYTWEFGDGSTESGDTTKHAYTHDGVYEVNLTVTDDDHLNDTETIFLAVTSGVTGVVLSESLEPIFTATVSVYRDGFEFGSMLTDSDGRFLIRNLPSGAYDITIFEEGYENYTGSVTLGDGLLDLGTIKLAEEAGGDDGEAIPSWVVGVVAGVAIAVACVALVAAFLVLKGKKG